MSMGELWALVMALALALGGGGVAATESATREPLAPAPALEVPEWARCPEWWPAALEAGWPPAEMPTLDRVMWCESRCSPAAYNRSSASGLMQVLARYFPAGADPLEPATNLAVALEVWEAQGWRAWSCW